MRKTVVYIQPLAPRKPAEGAPCNGCGICCLTEPCPLGIVLSRRRTGACVALHWSPEQGRYLCGVVRDPRALLQQWLPSGLRWSAAWLAMPLRRLAWRWIAAGQGCDSSLEPRPVVEPPAV